MSTVIVVSLMRMVRSALHRCTDPYRPELHYMRGPGPRWHAKHTIRLG